MEYCDQGDLATLIHSVKKLTENRVRVFIQQISIRLLSLNANNLSFRSGISADYEHSSSRFEAP